MATTITTTASTELKAYVTCSAVLFAKFVVATSVQGLKTFDAGGRPPEDKKLPWAKGRREQTYGLAAPDDSDKELKKAREVEMRWRRIVANDLESIPIALLVFAGGVFAGGNEKVYATSLGVYTFVRCFHTYAYANELQPHRAWCWRIGVLAITAGAINSLVGVYSS
ncbi:Inorganic phosphate transporter 1-6 [Globisporangium polare]